MTQDSGKGMELIWQEVLAQYMVLMMCRYERRQVELLERFQGEGLDCKALLS